MKKWYLIFLYTSLLFLAISLYQENYLAIPSISNYGLLWGSFISLFAGFYFSAYAWYKSIHCFGYRQVQLKDSVLSIGLSIFGKYIPGKLWMIVGRAGYISSVYPEIPTKVAGTISLNVQIMTLWVGFSLGSIAMLEIPIFSDYLYIITIGWCFFSVVFFSRVPRTLLERVYKKIFKKRITLPFFSFHIMKKALVWYAATWCCWSLSFYLGTRALIAQPDIPISIGFTFALAACLGIITVIAPGGLGVREGILFTCLISFGLTDQQATLISVASRLWFLIGECFIFMLALILKMLTGRKQLAQYKLAQNKNLVERNKHEQDVA